MREEEHEDDHFSCIVIVDVLCNKHCASWYGRRQYHCPDALIVFSGIVVVVSGYGGGGRLRCMDGGGSRRITVGVPSSDIFVLVGYGGRRGIISDIANSIVGSTSVV
jgi:hypothetical protein